MIPAEHSQVTDLRNVYLDLAAALGAAHHQAMLEGGSPDRVAVADHAVQRLWAMAVQHLAPGLDRADQDGIPPAVEPDPDAPTDLDVDAVLEHVARIFDPASDPPPSGRAGSARTAALVWAAAASCFMALLGVTGSGLVVVPALVPPIATALLMAWRGAGRAPGVVWAIGLVPLVLLLVGGSSSVLAAAVFVVLVEGFAYLTHLSHQALGSWEHEPRAQRGPLEIELVLYSLAAATSQFDDVALVVVACLAGLLWRRRWTAALAAAVTGLLLALRLESPASAVAADSTIFAVLAAHWARAILHKAWLAGRLSLTEMVLSLSGRTLRGSWRMAQRSVEAVLPPLYQPGHGTPGRYRVQGGGDGTRYCWTCHQKTPHQSAGFSLPICQRCVIKANGRNDPRTFSQWCNTCGGRNPHTDSGKCLACWKKCR